MEQTLPGFKVKEKDLDRLAYIHSNKLMTLKAFHRKFFPDKTEMNAWLQLAKFIKCDPPFIERIRGNHFEERYYILKSAALRYLDQRNVILVRDASKQVKLRSEDYTHDSRVINIRVAFEGNPDLKNVFWVSDHELRCRITPEVKAKFINGDLNKVAWRYNRKQDVYTNSKKGERPRTPDGYFEADYNGTREAFVLEYIHKRYSRSILEKVIYFLNQDPIFSKPFRLVVCQTQEDAEALIPKLKLRIKDRAKWFIGYYDVAVKDPFSKIWFNLARS